MRSTRHQALFFLTVGATSLVINGSVSSESFLDIFLTDFADAWGGDERESLLCSVVALDSVARLSLRKRQQRLQIASDTLHVEKIKRYKKKSLPSRRRQCFARISGRKEAAKIYDWRIRPTADLIDMVMPFLFGISLVESCNCLSDELLQRSRLG